MNDTPPTSENHPDRVFIWVDEDSVRCSPRHRTLKAALNFRKDRDGYWTREEGRNRYNERDLSNLPSQKQPKKLMVGEWLLRDLNPSEEEDVKSVKLLTEKGLI